MSATAYAPVDRLYLWMLTQPSRPTPVGELRLVRANQGVSLRYVESWRRDGYALSEDLPLTDQEFLPAAKASVAEDPVQHLLRRLVGGERRRGCWQRVGHGRRDATASAYAVALTRSSLLDGGAQWVVKFADGDPTDTPLIEHAAMTLARAAEIAVAETRPIRLRAGHAVAIRRFDRTAEGRVHCVAG